ncbi:MAG: hypothetical protein MUF33_03805 [Candidatus Nanopelagicales bacterium]|jgi:hypothetical protein|nr:hypothetical protein [Candidatus Nanopelagicales bacterium]
MKIRAGMVALGAVLAAMLVAVVTVTPASAAYTWSEETSGGSCEGASTNVWDWVVLDDKDTSNNGDDKFDVGPRSDNEDVTIQSWEWRWVNGVWTLVNIRSEIRWVDIEIQKKESGNYVNHWSNRWDVDGKYTYGLPNTAIDRGKEPRVRVEIKFQDKAPCVYRVAWSNSWE